MEINGVHSLSGDGDKPNHSAVEFTNMYLIHQCKILNEYYKIYPKKWNHDSNNCAVIVEPRTNHNLLEAICKNVMFFLPDDWNLVVFSNNEQSIKNRLTNIDYLYCNIIDRDNLDVIEYSNLLKSKEFWNLIPGENIIIFQTDSYMTRHMTPLYINKIKEYPFIGAVYKITNKEDNNKDMFCPIQERNFSMNGGFSFRRKSAMLHCIEKINRYDIITYRTSNNMAISEHVDYEDSYFEHALMLLKYELPSYDICRLFCTQTNYGVVNSYAIHGLYRDYVYSHLIYNLRPPLAETYDEVIEKIGSASIH